MKKRFFGIVLALIMVLSIMPFSALAESASKLPAPVVSITNNAATGKIKLSWGAVDGAAYYSVYRATSKDGTYSKVNTTKTTGYTDSAATIGNTYYYRVKANASDSAATSAYSSTVGRTCHCAKPVVKVAVSNGNPKLSWGAIDGVSYYSIYRATSKDGTYSKIKTTKITSFADTSAKVGQTYYYKVKANNENSKANSAYSSIVSTKVHIRLSTTSITTCQGTTKTLTATTSPSGAKVSWSSSNTSVAKVSSAGKVTAVAKGTATITAKITYNGTSYSATCKITVKNRLEAKVVGCGDGTVDIVFTNNTGKEVTRIDFDVYQYDSKGNRLESPFAGYYSNDSIDAHSAYGGYVSVNDATSSAKVKIQKVWFEDGTTWAP